MIYYKNGEYKYRGDYIVDEAIIATKEDVKNFEEQNYDEVFEEYDEDKHNTMYRRFGKHCVLETRKKGGENCNIDSDLYTFRASDHEIVFTETNLPDKNEYIDINNGMQKFIDHINFFFKNKEKYKKHGEPFRDSSLLYGDFGTGKTFTIMHTVKQLIEKYSARCFYLPGHISSLGEIFKFGDDLAEYDKVLIIEEIEERGGSDIEALANFLDGYNSWDNTYVVGTTNYPGKIPKKLTKRPGRFNTLIEAQMPDEKDIINFLNEKGIDIEKKKARQMNNFSYAHLQEISNLVNIKDMDIDVAIKKMRDHNKKVENNFIKESERAGMARNEKDNTSSRVNPIRPA